jgi:hypothetical protein
MCPFPLPETCHERIARHPPIGSTTSSAGLVNRRPCLGDAWVDKSLNGATEFNAEFQT